MTCVFTEDRWYAVQVKSRFEAVAAALLEQKGFPILYPTYTEHRRWNDRTRELPRPLFPGYVFCRFDARSRLPVLTTPHVMSVVGAGRIPVPVEDAEIRAVRDVQRSGRTVLPWPFLGAGEKVRVIAGPLRGLEGLLLSTKNESRLVISVTLLRRSIAVEVDRVAVEPVHAGRAPVARRLPAESSTAF